jgi:hypothetical protein
MTKNQKNPDVGDMSIETACKHFVTLNFGIERRKPDCPDCRVPYAGYEVDQERQRKKKRTRRVTPV